MTTSESAAAEYSEKTPSISEFRYVVKIFFKRKLSLIGLIIIILLVLTAIFAPYLAPYSPLKVNLVDAQQQPSWRHLLGTDINGRDTLSRIIYGARTSLAVAFGAMAIAAIIGVVMGLIAGYFGGAVYMIIMRLVDAMMSIPMLILALFLAALMGGGLKNVIIALGISLTSIYARLMCGQVLSVRENDYILASRAIGAGNFRTMLHHIVPNAFPPLLVMVTLQLGTMILAEAGLSFIGVGIQPPTPAWGAMINTGYPYLFTYPMLSLAPGVAIALVVFSFNMVGDGLRDALDPRLRGIL
jgi:peptide/nickel transport system permease protein